MLGLLAIKLGDHHKRHPCEEVLLLTQPVINNMISTTLFPHAHAHADDDDDDNDDGADVVDVDPLMLMSLLSMISSQLD